MTTGVNVDFISNGFFTCKDRALERDRPEEKKSSLCVGVWLRVKSKRGNLELEICNLS